jgi:hypothetical protein
MLPTDPLVAGSVVDVSAIKLTLLDEGLNSNEPVLPGVRPEMVKLPFESVTLPVTITLLVVTNSDVSPTRGALELSKFSATPLITYPLGPGVPPPPPPPQPETATARTAESDNPSTNRVNFGWPVRNIFVNSILFRNYKSRSDRKGELRVTG